MELNAKEFVAALKFVLASAGKNDVRYYLNGVAFEVKSGNITLVGCDGHRGAFVELKGSIDMPDMVYIVERADVDTMIKAVNKRETVSLVYDDDGMLAAHIDLDKIALRQIDGKYPDWRKALIPNDALEATEQFGINAKYLAEAAKNCLLLTRKYPAISIKLRGANSVIEISPDIDPDYFECIKSASMVVMPLRR